MIVELNELNKIAALSGLVTIPHVIFTVNGKAGVAVGGIKGRAAPEFITMLLKLGVLLYVRQNIRALYHFFPVHLSLPLPPALGNKFTGFLTE